MTPTPSDDISWEPDGLLPDCLVAALGDERLREDETWLSNSLPFLHELPDGCGMVYALAEEDFLPVEIGSSVGRIVGVRLEFTNDVAELEASGQGRWRTLGRLRVGNDGVIAVDTKHRNMDEWIHHVDLPAGWYAAQAFDSEYDALGIRLMIEE